MLGNADGWRLIYNVRGLVNRMLAVGLGYLAGCGGSRAYQGYFKGCCTVVNDKRACQTQEKLSVKRIDIQVIMALLINWQAVQCVSMMRPPAGIFGGLEQQIPRQKKLKFLTFLFIKYYLSC